MYTSDNIKWNKLGFDLTPTGYIEPLPNTIFGTSKDSSSITGTFTSTTGTATLIGTPIYYSVGKDNYLTINSFSYECVATYRCPKCKRFMSLKKKHTCKK